MEPKITIDIFDGDSRIRYELSVESDCGNCICELIKRLGEKVAEEIYKHELASNYPDSPEYCFRCGLKSFLISKFPTCNDYLDYKFGKNNWFVKGYLVKEKEVTQ